LQNGLVPYGADGLGVWRRNHGGTCAASFPGFDEGGDQGLPSGMWPRCLVGVDGCFGVIVHLRPDVADVMALWTVILCYGQS